MLTEPQKIWVAALRDPSAKQGQRQLSSEEGDCCLGVGAKCWAKTTGNLLPEGWGEHPILCGIEELLEVRTWLGLRKGDGRYYDDKYHECWSLADQNDTGMDFPSIADLIESEPDGLFMN